MTIRHGNICFGRCILVRTLQMLDEPGIRDMGVLDRVNKA